MDSITHILTLFNSLNQSSFKFSAFIRQFDYFKKDFPSSISLLLNDSDLIYHLSQAIYHLEAIFSFLDSTISSPLKREISKLYKFPSSGTPYADFSVDFPPITKPKPSFKTFNQLNQERLNNHLPVFKPVNRRNNTFTFKGNCPYCGASHDYIYDNNHQGQLKCKVCTNCFNINTVASEEAFLCCPYCEHKLSVHHERAQYNVLVCPNNSCSFYIKNLKKVEAGDTLDMMTSSKQIKLKYTHREFNFSLDSLKESCVSLDCKVNLSRIYHSKYVLGLILTYYINYGLSSRKTAAILRDIHGVTISHQTVKNYASSVSKIVKTFVDTYPYELSNILVGDETYVNVLGKHHYVFFFSDPIKRIITSYDIHPVRSTLEACQAIHQSISKYSSLPADLEIITDGNPIYNAAQVFFAMSDIKFLLHQVIGLSNKDETSTKYRPYKQIEERLNRTYKHNYHTTNGFNSLEKANEHMVLFVCFFNFLRPNSALHYETPVDDNLFGDEQLMFNKWLMLIDKANELNHFGSFTSTN